MAKPPIDVQALQDRCRDLSDLIDELWGISAANRALEPDEGDGDAVGMAVLHAYGFAQMRDALARFRLNEAEAGLQKLERCSLCREHKPSWERCATVCQACAEVQAKHLSNPPLPGTVS
jgi:hypothetical protein